MPPIPQCTEDALVRDESFRAKPYRDSVGKLTIGIGRNLDDVGISENEARVMLGNDLQKVRAQIAFMLPWAKKLSAVRMSVLENMAFNMGMARLLGFKTALQLMELADYGNAAVAMLDSAWAKQVGARALRLAEQMRTDQWQ
jgi:lysozyme